MVVLEAADLDIKSVGIGDQVLWDIGPEHAPTHAVGDVVGVLHGGDDPVVVVLRDTGEEYHVKWHAIRAIHPRKATTPPGMLEHPKVKGICPACGLQLLFLAAGGFVTCGNVDCKAPDAAHALLWEATYERMKRSERGVSTRGYEIPSGLAGELKRWWLDEAEADFEQTVPKMLEYGGETHRSSDLEVMGDALIELLGWDAFALETRPVAQELGAWFYALGKVSRLLTDYKAGRPGKADTWFDLSVYCMMARRIQQTGAWPGETT